MPLRPATSADCRNLAEVQIASWRAAYHGIIPDHILDTLSVKSFETVWKHNLRNANRTNVVALVEEDTVGFVSYGPSRDGDTDPRQRRRSMASIFSRSFGGADLVGVAEPRGGRLVVNRVSGSKSLGAQREQTCTTVLRT